LFGEDAPRYQRPMDW